jgi:hypothetical protein
MCIHRNRNRIIIFSPGEYAVIADISGNTIPHGLHIQFKSNSRTHHLETKIMETGLILYRVWSKEEQGKWADNLVDAYNSATTQITTRKRPEEVCGINMPPVQAILRPLFGVTEEQSIMTIHHISQPFIKQ